MQMPHRAITPDTIVFHANGEPLLISDDIDAGPAPDSHQADDLTALASVIHYAITQELMPTGPLHGRVAGYSAAVVATVDACMDPDPTRRPSSFSAARGLLGIVAPEPLAGAVSLPAAPAPTADVGRGLAGAVAGMEGPNDAAVTHHTGMRHGRRWAIAAGGGAIAIALSLVWFTDWRDIGSHDHVVQTPPQTSKRADQGLAATSGAASVVKAAITAPTDQATMVASGDPAGNAAGDKAKNVADTTPTNPASNLADSPASGASSEGTTRSGGDVDQPGDMTRVSPDPADRSKAANPANPADSVATTVPRAVSARAAAVPQSNRKAAAVTRAALPSAAYASYQLQIKPWGVVYVDGVDRGISPPLTRLVLTPGRHTIRIANPKYRDSILEFESARTTNIGKILVEFDREPQ